MNLIKGLKLFITIFICLQIPIVAKLKEDWQASKNCAIQKSQFFWKRDPPPMTNI